MANTVVFMSDEHNPLYSEPYGHGAVETPHMRALAEEGALFEHAYTPSPLCLPARSAFHSGRYVHESRCYNNCNVNLPDGLTSFGSILGQHGVHTVHMGKAHLWRPVGELGYSEVVHPSEHRPPGDRECRRNPLAIRAGARGRADGYGQRPEAFSRPGRVVGSAVDWLRDTAPTLDRPWVLFVSVGPPHFPHVATPELWDKYSGCGDLPDPGPEHPTGRHPRAADLRAHFQTEGFSEAQTRGLRRGYLACVDWVDQQLGRLREAVETAGLRGTTNLVYCSDHGEMLGRFGMWWKCSLYEDSARVPLIAAGPDYDGRGRVDTAVSLMDLQASLFASAGVPMPGGRRGQPLQTVPDHDDTRPVFSEYHGHGTRASSYMIRRGPWKLIHHVKAPHQLFHVLDDPGELEDRYETERGIARSLEAELRGICDPEAENDRAEAFIEGQLAAVGGPQGRR